MLLAFNTRKRESSDPDEEASKAWIAEQQLKVQDGGRRQHSTYEKYNIRTPAKAPAPWKEGRYLL